MVGAGELGREVVERLNAHQEYGFDVVGFLDDDQRLRDAQVHGVPVLGTIDDDSVARIVEQSEGNAFYLEELIRWVAEGRGDVLPETILAMAQSRLKRLETDARRILRGANRP